MPDDIVQQLRDAACGNDCHCHYCERNKAAANEIERLTLERDEARQQVCRQMLLRNVLFHRIGAASVAVTKESDVAKWMGWDCYKEETRND